MHKVKGRGKGGSRRTKRNGGKRYVPLETPAEHIVLLRAALFEKDGTDRDVTASLKPFCSFTKAGLDLVFKFVSGADFKKNKALTEFAFSQSKKTLKDLYDTSGFGWDDLERKQEMCDQAVRFLFVYDKKEATPLGFLQFSITMQGALVDEMSGYPCIFVSDCQLLPVVQRKGLGSALLNLLCLIAVKLHLSFVLVRVIKGCTEMENLMSKKMKGFQVDESAYHSLDSDEFDDLNDSFTVFSRCVDKKILKSRVDKDNVHALAHNLAQKLSTKE